ncbi:MAG: hypothetical protein Kow0025_01150 [Thermodesulfovibrionales bacterium]
MAATSRDTLEYHARTVIGVLILLFGLLGGLWLGWWLCARGDIVQIIHSIKMNFPSWVWTALRIGLSAFFGLLFISFFVALSLIVLGTGGRRANRKR